MASPAPAPHLRSQDDVLNRDYLEVRSRILELAAALDRYDRARDTAGGATDARLGLIRQGLEALLSPDSARAEAVQTIFSLTYDPDWRNRFGLTGHSSKNGR